MSVRQFKKVFAQLESPSSREFNTGQDHLEQVLTPLTNSSIVDGVHIKNIDLTHSVDNLTEHKLGREPLGWIVVRKFAAIDIYESLTVDGVSYDRKKFINFLISGTTSMSDVDFWIF